MTETLTSVRLEPATRVTAEELIVTVTPAHIARGRQVDMERCAVGLALQDAGYSNVLVGDWRVTVDGHEYSGSPWFMQWIHDFDNGKPVYPERFRLPRIAAQSVSGHKQTPAR